MLILVRLYAEVNKCSDMKDVVIDSSLQPTEKCRIHSVKQFKVSVQNWLEHWMFLICCWVIYVTNTS